MPAPESDFDREIRALENEIKRLEAEYNMFFAGRLPRLPWERKARVETLMKNFDRNETRNTADRFRFQTLQARFVKFLELWDRQLRDREEGSRPTRQARDHAPKAKAAPVKKLPVAAPPAPAERAFDVVNFERATADADRVKELYERVAAAKREVGEAPLGLDRITALVNAQLRKHGADADVSFQIAVKDGKVSLSVKPTKG